MYTLQPTVQRDLTRHLSTLYRQGSAPVETNLQGPRSARVSRQEWLRASD